MDFIGFYFYNINEVSYINFTNILNKLYKFFLKLCLQTSV